MGLEDVLTHEKIYALLDRINEVGIEKIASDHPKQLGAILALARKNPVIFNDFCFRDKKVGYWRSAPFHREWQRIYPSPFSGLFVAIFAPRAHAKTSQMVMGRTIYELGLNPDLLIKIVCNTDDKAKKRVTELQQQIEINERVRLVFPGLVPDKDSGWEKHKFFIQRKNVSREPTVESYGILSGATGDRADVLVFDDVVDKRNAVLQPLLREQVKETFRDVWLNILGPEGTAVYIATPWHLNDLTHELMEDPEWRPWKKPATDEDGKLLWEAVWDRDALDTRRKRIGDRAYQQQFMLRALSAEDATFSQKAIETSKRPLRFGEWHRGEPIPSDWPVFGGVDLASAMGKKASETVIMTGAVSPDHIRYPINIIKGKLKFPQIIEALISEFKTYHHDLILVENNSFQEAVLQQLPEDHKGIPVRGHYTSGRKWDDITGLPGLCATMENEGWVLPMPCSCDKVPCTCHAAACECVSCEWERELRYHPRWKSSDIVMAQWLLETAAREGTRSKDRGFIDVSGAKEGKYDG